MLKRNNRAKGLELKANEPLIISRIASGVIVGQAVTDIAKDLNLAESTIREYLKKDEVKMIIADSAEQAISTARSVVKQRTSAMAKKVLDVIEKHLDEGNLESVKVALKIMGFDNKQLDTNANTSEGNITVIMPSIASVKDVKSDVIVAGDGHDKIQIQQNSR